MQFTFCVLQNDKVIHYLKKWDFNWKWFNYDLDDVVIGISIAGVVKVWALTGNEVNSLDPIYEDESKPLRCLNAIKLTCCIYNQRTVLVVCAKYWQVIYNILIPKIDHLIWSSLFYQVYDAGDFSLLCSVDTRRGERWSGGDFLSADRVVVWSDYGRAYLYKLPSK